MTSYGRRLIVDATFERALIETMRAVQLEGLDILTRLDLREHLKRHIHHECRRYVLLQVASPDLMLRALQTDIESGPFLPITLGISGDRYFEVTSGLAPGDQVVTGPYNSVRSMVDDWAEVTVLTNWTMEGEPCLASS